MQRSFSAVSAVYMYIGSLREIRLSEPSAAVFREFKVIHALDVITEVYCYISGYGHRTD